MNLCVVDATSIRSPKACVGQIRRSRPIQTDHGILRYFAWLRFQKEMRGTQDMVLNHTATRSKPRVIERIRAVPIGGNWADIPKEILQVDGEFGNISNTHPIRHKRLLPGEPSTTITNSRKVVILHPVQNRILSVREAARIQTRRDTRQKTKGAPSWHRAHGCRRGSCRLTACLTCRTAYCRLPCTG